MLYDNENNTICIELTRGKISHVVELGNIIVHVSKSGRPILIEVLDASSLLGQFDALSKIKDIKDLNNLPAI